MLCADVIQTNKKMELRLKVSNSMWEYFKCTPYYILVITDLFKWNSEADELFV